MKEITCTQFSTGWMDLLHHLTGCEPVLTRGLLNREEDCVAFRVHDSSMNILAHPARKMNYRFMIAEWTWYMRGLSDVASLARFNPNIAEFSDNGITFAGAYGPRLLPQWDYVEEKLKADSFTRQAVASIWTPNPEPSKDIPCTLSLQFLRRWGRLNLIVTMRSSDIWLGLPYDMFSFSQMQNCLAGKLGVERGWIQFNLGSSHLYDKHIEQARELIGLMRHGFTMQSPALPGWLPDLETAPLTEPWLTYAKIINGTKTSAEALEMLNAASKLG